MINDDGIGHYSNGNTKVLHVNGSTMIGHGHGHGGLVDLKSLFGASQYVGHDGSMGAYEGGAAAAAAPPPHRHVSIKIDKLQMMRQVAELESLLMSNDKMDDFGFSPTNGPLPMSSSTRPRPKSSLDPRVAFLSLALVSTVLVPPSFHFHYVRDMCPTNQSPMQSVTRCMPIIQCLGSAYLK